MASGDTLLARLAIEATFPASNFATLDQRNNHWVLDFDKTTGETAYFSGIMPENYDGGDIVFDIVSSLTTVTSGTLGYLVAFERIGAAQQDIDSDGFGADQTVTAATVPGTTGHTMVSSVTVPAGAATDSIVAGEAFRVRVTRDVANDTADNDAELWGIHLKEA